MVFLGHILLQRPSGCHVAGADKVCAGREAESVGACDALSCARPCAPSVRLFQFCWLVACECNYNLQPADMRSVSALQALPKARRGRKSRPRMSNSVAGALKQHDKEVELLREPAEPVEEQVGVLEACTGHERGMRGPAGADWR